MPYRPILPPHLSLWSQHNPELADNLNYGHLYLQQGKSHCNAASRTVPKRQVSTRMTLGLLLWRKSARKGGHSNTISVSMVVLSM